MQEINKVMRVTAIATGIQGISVTCAVSRFAASFPYYDVITKKGYDMG